MCILYIFTCVFLFLERLQTCQSKVCQACSAWLWLLNYYWTNAVQGRGLVNGQGALPSKNSSFDSVILNLTPIGHLRNVCKSKILI